MKNNVQKKIKETKELIQFSVFSATIVISLLNIWLAYKLIPIEKNLSALAVDVDYNKATILGMEQDINTIMTDVKDILKLL